LGLVVAGVEGGEFLEVLPHILLFQLFQQRRYRLTVSCLRWVCDALNTLPPDRCTEVARVGYVEEVDALLNAWLALEFCGVKSSLSEVLVRLLAP
jgi:hypothetical protein